jgi:hypothetical protein
MGVCVCVCMGGSRCANMCICIIIHLCIPINAHTHIRTYIHTKTHTQPHTYTNTHTYMPPPPGLVVLCGEHGDNCLRENLRGGGEGELCEGRVGVCVYVRGVVHECYCSGGLWCSMK